ncbi:MAG: 23S rRNA (pseudouridine(1915)-N(3))-methyltransferase RlmH [Alphaproteobacteria bacterium]
MLLLPTGTCKDKHLLALEADYLKRLKKPWLLEVRELKASKAENPAQAKAEEAATQLAALKSLPAGTLPVLLHEHSPDLRSPKGVAGPNPTTEALAKQLQTWLNNGQTPAFFIGGAAGFHESVLAAVPTRLSLSPLTFPHQLCRVMLAEQVYRAYTLAIGHPYHRP